MFGIDDLITGAFDVANTGANIMAAKQLQDDAQEFQREEWTRQFNLQNERQDYLLKYQSPSEYINRLREAGLNPAALLQSGGNFGQLSAPGVSSPGQVVSPHYSPSEIGFGNMFEHFGNFAKALADAKKTGVDTKLLQDTFDDQVRLLRQRVTSAELENASRRLDNFIKDQVKDVKIKQAYKDYDFTCTMEANARFTGENIKADTSLKKAQELLSLASERLTAKQYEELSIIVRNKQAIIDSEIKRNLASANASNASATASIAAAGMYQSQTELNYAFAETENKMREGKLTLQELHNTSQRIANTIGNSNMRTFVATEGDRLKALVSEYERQGFITETVRANMQQAITNANWAEVEKYLGAMSQAIGTVAGVYNSGSMRMNSLSNVQRNQIKEKFVEAYDRYHNSEH